MPMHCKDHTELDEKCKACQEACRAELKNKKFVMAGQHEVDLLEPELDLVLEAMKHPEALITDLSTIGDFYIKSKRKDLNIEKELSEKLGVRVSMDDYLVDIAVRMRAKK